MAVYSNESGSIKTLSTDSYSIEGIDLIGCEVFTLPLSSRNFKTYSLPFNYDSYKAFIIASTDSNTTNIKSAINIITAQLLKEICNDTQKETNYYSANQTIKLNSNDNTISISGASSAFTIKDTTIIGIR